VRLLKSATPVKAKTSAPAPSHPASCAALTWRGLERATRTGSRERGGGPRQTLDRQQDRGDPLHCRGRNDSGTVWATPLEQGGGEICSRWLPFSVAKSQVVPFFVVTWPPNLSSSDTFKGIAGPDPDEKLAPDIIDKYTSTRSQSHRPSQNRRNTTEPFPHTRINDRQG
jgi:hypothetical protein